MYEMVVTPNPILVKAVEPVKKFDKKLSEIIKNMQKTLVATSDPVGVGLAAPQVGIPLSVFMARPKDKGPITTFINPEIIPQIDAEEENADRRGNLRGSAPSSAKIRGSQKKGKLLEGCLSIPNIWGHVLRKKEITVSWQDEEGHKHTKNFKGFPAVIIQHEMDHLNGVLFTKHVMDQGEKLYKSHKDAEGVEVFDEVKL